MQNIPSPIILTYSKLSSENSACLACADEELFLGISRSFWEAKVEKGCIGRYKSFVSKQSWEIVDFPM